MSLKMDNGIHLKNFNMMETTQLYLNQLILIASQWFTSKSTLNSLEIQKRQTDHPLYMLCCKKMAKFHIQFTLTISSQLKDSKLMQAFNTWSKTRLMETITLRLWLKIQEPLIASLKIWELYRSILMKVLMTQITLESGKTMYFSKQLQTISHQKSLLKEHLFLLFFLELLELVSFLTLDPSLVFKQTYPIWLSGVFSSSSTMQLFWLWSLLSGLKLTWLTPFGSWLQLRQ